MTDETYRNRGLRRVLIEKVLKESEFNSDLIYCFANDSVLNFFLMNEYQYSKEILYKETDIIFEKLDMTDKKIGSYFMIELICQDPFQN